MGQGRAFFLALLCAACGSERDAQPDNNTQTIMTVEPSQTTIGPTDAIFVRFSTDVDEDSLELSGDLQVGSDTVWVNRRVLSISPVDAWPIGANQHLNVSIRSVQGDAISTEITIDVFLDVSTY